jgi:hypothetical protein
VIDWQKVTLNLRTHFGPLTKVAKVVGSDERHLNRLARGDVEQPRFNTGCKLLDLHLDACPDKHNFEGIGI